MRRDNRVRNNKKNTQNRIIMYSIIGVAFLAVVLVGLLIYSKSLNDNVNDSIMNLEEMANANEQQNVQNTNNSTSVSTDMGKTVDEAKNEMANNINVNATNNTTSSTGNNTVEKANKEVQANTSKKNEVKSNVVGKNNTTAATTTDKKENKTETKKELSFVKPVEGEIMREYAKDNLIYSNTLQEWTTHLGVDIKAEKTTVVKAAEAGTVKSIKNDPRYGLTITIDHGNGFQTVYSNLLSSEFVVEGEKVNKGQSIGTVGNTAAFEIADEAHLHFEILKDAIQVDPNIYLK